MDAETAIEAKQYQQASVMLRTSLNRFPQCADAQYLLAYALFRQGLAKESLAQYTAAARLRNPAAADLRSVALDYVLLNDNADAAKWAQRALDLNDKDAESWYVLGRIQYSTGRFLDALADFEHTLALEPGSVKAEDNLGLAYEGLNQPDNAKSAYQKAIEIGERSHRPSEQPLLNLSILLTHEGKFDAALALLLKAVALAPENASVRENLGHVYMEQKNYSQAELELKKAIALRPADSRLHFLLGQVYQRQGQPDKAKPELDLAAAMNGTHSTPAYPE